MAIYLDNDYILTHQADGLYRNGLSGVWSGNAPAYFDDFKLSSDDIAAVPEPSTLVNGLLGMGLTGFGA